jgi:hexosaminidase
MLENKLKDEAGLQTWLIEEMAKFLSSKDKKIIGWDEILEGGIPADAAIQSWRGIEGGVAGAQAKHAVIMSPTSHCYFDYGLQSIDTEKVYQFDPVPSSLTKEEAGYIRGAECNMWTEHAPQELVDSKVFPRLLAMSEVLWTYPNNRDYTRFSKKLDAHFPRLAKMGVHYGLPKLATTLSFSQNSNQQMVVHVKPGFDGVTFIYDQVEIPASDFEITEDREAIAPWIGAVPEPYTLNDSIVPLNNVRLTITPIYGNQSVRDQTVALYIHQHLGYGKPLKRNFSTNKYYPASGDNAFADGLCHSSGFRDGYWQGVVQKELEIISDLESVQTVQFCNSNWYHYANAWIFRPDRVIYYSSLDGVNWTELGRFEAAIESSDKREMPLLYPIWFTPKKARHIKMVVQGIGACPSWHDAPGEPSWLFGDELIIR